LEYVPEKPSEALVQALGAMTTRDFSMTMLLGGKLRALYNEAEQPRPTRIDELLRNLERATTTPVGQDALVFATSKAVASDCSGQAAD